MAAGLQGRRCLFRDLPYLQGRSRRRGASRAGATLAGQGGPIEYEDSSGKWHEEQEKGDGRPDTDVKD